MSQQKVEKYKEEKKNRKKIIAKQKREKVLRNCTMTLVIIAFFAFIGFSIYKDYFYKEPSNTEPTTFSLSEKEISKVWNEYEEQDTSESVSSSENESSEENKTTSSEETTSSEK